MTRSALALAVVAALAALASACSDGRGDRTGKHAVQPPAAPAGRACSEPDEGCACSGDQAPVPCYPSAGAGSAPGVCLEGTRRCVDGVFGACEDVRAFAAPDPSLSALVDQTVRHPQCSDCDPRCFVVRDELSPDDGPLEASFSEGLVFHQSGAGLTLEQGDAGPGLPPLVGLPVGSLVTEVLVARTATATHRHRYEAPPTDVYFLTDMAPSMSEELSWLADRYTGGASYLDGSVECAGGDDSLIEQGVTGAVRCMVEDAWFGSGAFGDIPFAPYSIDETLPLTERDVRARANIAFEQNALMSSTPQASLLRSSSSSSENPDVAGSQTVALHSLASGDGAFMGIGRRAVPAATACDDGEEGQACFRADADRVVVMLTDRPMHNGPEPASYPYDPAHLAMQIGTGPTAIAIPSTNEDFPSAYPIASDVASELLVYTGNSAGMACEVLGPFVGCGADDAASDVVFSFDVGSTSEPLDVTMAAQSSAFSGVLAVVTGPPAYPEVLPAGDDLNELFESARELGNVRGRFVQTTGDTTLASAAGDMRADYQGSLLGPACGASSLAPDAVYAFDVGSSGDPIDVTVRADMGGSRAVVAVYEDTGARRWPAVASPLSASGNDDARPANVFEIPSGAGNEYVSVSGSTSALQADYNAADLGGEACNPDSAAKDAAFQLHVEGTRTLRFDTEGSSFDTVLSLHDRAPLTNAGAMLRWPAADTHDNGNEDASTAYDVGEVNGRSQVFEGDTTGMRADVTDTFGCGTQTDCGDAVYRMTVTERTALRIEVEGTGYEPGVVITRADPAGVSGKYLPIAAGGQHTCAISAGEVFCWGADDRGQLGDGGALGAADSSAPVRVSGITNAQSICAGSAHACATTADGRVHCWGAGGNGRLGDDGTADQGAPVRAIGIGEGEALGPAAQVSCGEAFSCALLRDGRVACFGANNLSQLGDNTTTERRAPVLVATSERFQQVEAGSRHACAVRTGDGAVFCWGEGAYGKLGDNATTNNPTPARAGTLAGATFVMAGGSHTCASLSSGRVYCWGRNHVGQLGRGSTSPATQLTPIVVRNADGSADLANVRGGLGAGDDHTCVATLEGFVMCWGGNGNRAIGHDNSTTQQLRPIGVHNMLDAVHVASGYEHSCAVRASGPIMCWGLNADAQLGDGTATTPPTPVRSQAGASGAAVSFGDGTVDAAFTQACSSAGQPPEQGCQLRAFNGENYYFCDEAQHARTWAGAAQSCEAIGMQLAVVDELGENEFVASQLESGEQAWLGIKRETDDTWLELGEEPHFETITGERVWYTENVSRWTGEVEGIFTGVFATIGLVGSPSGWTRSSTWAEDEPSSGDGENCVTIDSAGKWRTARCSAVPQRDCGFLGLSCLFSFLGDLVGGILGWIVPWVGDITRVIFDTLAGRFAAPQFSGGVDNKYVCEEVEQPREITLDPGDYYVTVKGVDDGISGNACEGPYELTLTDLGTPGGGFLACDDNGVAESASSVIERTLTTGDYYVILKGKRAGDAGDYQLTVRDVGAVPSNALGCDASAGSGDPASLQIRATPGRHYYAVVKGDGPLDKGPFEIEVGDSARSGGELLGCSEFGPGFSNPLTVPLSEGTYYAVLKGSDAWSAGPYQLSIGGADAETDTYDPPTYAETIDALSDRNIRVAAVVSCDPEVASCADAIAQANVLAEDTGGAAVTVASAADTPAQVVRAIELAAGADRISGSLVFAPDLNPGFNPVGVEPLPDPGNRCTLGADGESFVDCAPGATPAFVASFHNPLLAPVALAAHELGLYEFTLRITTERASAPTQVDDIPILVRPANSPVPGSYTRGSYFQDFEATACAELNRLAMAEQPARPTAPLMPSWDQLHFKADVHPDTSVSFFACGAGLEEELEQCDDDPARNPRVLTITAGTGGGTPCRVATQATDCPKGYCSPYTQLCQYLEGMSCEDDADCPGTGTGRCHSGPSASELGRTCVVEDQAGPLAGALGRFNLPFMRMTLELESGGDGSRAPSVFEWEARYRCEAAQ